MHDWSRLAFVAMAQWSCMLSVSPHVPRARGPWLMALVHYVSHTICTVAAKEQACFRIVLAKPPNVAGRLGRVRRKNMVSIRQTSELVSGCALVIPIGSSLSIRAHLAVLCIAPFKWQRDRGTDVRGYDSNVPRSTFCVAARYSSRPNRSRVHLVSFIFWSLAPIFIFKASWAKFLTFRRLMHKNVLGFLYIDWEIPHATVCPFPPPAEDHY